MINRTFLTGFAFKPVESKKHKRSINTYRSKLVYCVCIQNLDGEFNARLNIKDVSEFPNKLEIPFTSKSYELKGKTKVFTVGSSKVLGKGTCIIRTKEEANLFPGLPTQYTPFKHKFVYSGYIVKVDNHYEFDINEVFGGISISSIRNLVYNIKIDDIK